MKLSGHLVNRSGEHEVERGNLKHGLPLKVSAAQFCDNTCYLKIPGNSRQLSSCYPKSQYTYLEVEFPMDPLSITASIIAVLYVINRVINTCYEYWSAVKGYPSGLSKVVDEVTSLRNVLENLRVLAVRAQTPDSAVSSRLPTLELLRKHSTGPLIICLEQLKILENKLTSLSESSHGWPKNKSDLIGALKWPLKKEDTKKILENIERLKSTLNLAITEDQA